MDIKKERGQDYMVDNNDNEDLSGFRAFTPFIFKISSNLEYLNDIDEYIATIYLKRLVYNDAFNEIHNKFKRTLFKRRKKLVKSEFVGIWGWNSWCGIHTFPILTDGKIYDIYKNTVDVGFTHREEGTGLLPHAVLHKIDNNGVIEFAGEPTYKCYDGVHGEDYNIDNILCWAKMAMEYFLATGDFDWFNAEKMRVISMTIDFFLDNYRDKFNPELIYTGIEGDWTECTNWTLDNSNASVNMLRTLELFIECEKLFTFKNSFSATHYDYQDVFDRMLLNFNKPVEEGGFWHDDLGFYVHGNDGKGGHIEGDKYFESTVNYFALLWGYAPKKYANRIFEYLNTKGKEVENPPNVALPVLTNYMPRTNARRKRYGYDVTNGDIWTVLGAHATAARLKYGFIDIGTGMYKKLLQYGKESGFFHNSVYLDGSFNDSWDPEVANNGTPYPPLLYGLLGLKLNAGGIEFNISALQNIKWLKLIIFLFNSPHLFQTSWHNNEHRPYQTIVAKLDKDRLFSLIQTNKFDLNDIDLNTDNDEHGPSLSEIIIQKEVINNCKFTILRDKSLKIEN
ncbi:MAG: hypothetical protein ACTSVC_04670 [Promethearchaeota archaeon]